MIRKRSSGKSAGVDVFTHTIKAMLGVECVKEYRFHPERRWRFDYAMPEHKIAVEVEGGVWVRGRHVAPQGFMGDMEKYNTATAMGWRVLRCTPRELQSRQLRELIAMCINATNR